METPIIRKYDTPQDMAEAMATDFLEYTKQCIAETNNCIVALSGGSTPNALFQLLGSDAYRNDLDWEHIIFIWVDERYVPHSDEASNYGKAKELLFSTLSNSFHTCSVPTNDEASVEGAAEAYEREIENVLKACAKKAPDLTLLGIGADGHMASLFPKSSTLQVWDKKVAYVKDGKQWERITLTLPFLIDSKEIWYAVAGEDKKAALSRVLRQADSYRHDSWQKRVDRTLPGAIIPMDHVTFYLDEEAAPEE